MMAKVFGKKLFGTKYEKIIRTLIVNFALFGGLQGAGIKLTVAPFIIYLMTYVLTVGEMWQALGSDDNAENMKNLIMMPFSNREFVFSYVTSLGFYTFICRTMPLLAIIFAVSGVQAPVVITVILCVISATLLTAAIFAQKNFKIPVAICLLAVISLDFIWGSTWHYCVVVLVSIIFAFALLIKTDAYAFYLGEGKRSRTVKGRNTSSVWIYIFRYMKEHKNYMTNTVFFWGLGLLFPTFLKELLTVDASLIRFAVPLGFAILCLNTPIGILLSCDKSLETAVRFLPGQKRAFCLPYCGFVFVCNLIAESIYLCSCWLQLGIISKELVLAVVFFSMQSSIFTIFLEWFFPIRNWKIENDLWHHPRKYVIPVIMVMFSGFVGVLPVTIYIFFAILVIEGAVLLYRCCME